MPASRKLKVAALDDVIIDRDDLFAYITFKDPDYASMRLQIGEEVISMSDEEILAAFNDTVSFMQESVESNPPVEIADGFPQIKFDKRSRQWHPVGDVLRCELVHDGDVLVQIDDKELSLEEFAEMLGSLAGYGMRVMFVHPSQLLDPPEPVVCKRRPEPTIPASPPPYPSVFS